MADYGIRVEISCDTVLWASGAWTTHGLFTGEGRTPGEALSALEDAGRNEAGRFAQRAVERAAEQDPERSATTSWTVRFSISPVQLAAGPLLRGEQGWVAYGSLIHVAGPFAD